MSLASKISVAAATIISTGIIAYVHYQQKEDRKRLHDGVLRDVERQHNRHAQSVVQEYKGMTDYDDYEAEQDLQDVAFVSENTKPPLSPHEKRNSSKNRRFIKKTDN